jgi:CDP-glucose 4,6-dehydratase
MIDKKFWIDKTVLITGHTGFKGSWLAVMLKTLGAQIIGISDFKKLSDNYQSISDKNIFKKEYELNIYDNDIFNNKLDIKNLDYVFHFAAQGLVSQAYNDPLETIKSNIIGTYNVLEFINNQTDSTVLIIATTDKVYLNTHLDNKEEDHLGGKEFYSATKASAEHIIEAYINTKKRENLNIGVVRSGNVLGGGDGAKDRIATDIVNSILKKNNIILRNPNAIRPWQYVLDSLTGYLLTAQYCRNNLTNEVFNLNSEINNKYTVKDLTQKLIENWKPDYNIEIELMPGSFYETEILRINSDKASKLLNWTAIYDINDISSSIAEWYKAYQLNKGISDVQVLDYLQKLNI